MTLRSRSGFGNAAADKIWNDHLGNNAFVVHRDRCETCTATYHAGGHGPMCPEGERVLRGVVEEVLGQIDEVLTNQN